MVDLVGRPGVVGVALLVAATAMLLSAGSTLQMRAAQLREGLAAQLTRPANERTPNTERAMSTEQQLARFHAFFPMADTAPHWLRVFQRTAVEQGLSLPSGEYRMDRRPDDALLRYRIAMPVQGTYAQLRSFVTEVLVRVPAASLDEIELQRDNPNGKTLEARLRFSLYLRPAP